VFLLTDGEYTMPSASSYENVVESLYVAYFGQPADPFGLLNFEAALAADDGGGTATTLAGLESEYSTNPAIQSLVDSFGSSPESAALYGNPVDSQASAESFVTAIFENCLNRPPDEAGLTFWVNAITDGTVTPAGAALAIAAGVEAAAGSNAAGAADAATFAAKVAAATDFTAALTTPADITDYDTGTGEEIARTWLASVTADNVATAENLIPATIEQIDEAACYCAGTLIAAGRGQVPVEDLAIGDMVTTASGALRPIKWIGRRSYGGRFVMGRKGILPVCIKAGALDDNVPKRDLWISPNHAMYFKDERGGVLIEAKDLVNGVSIVQAERVEQVEYFHIELETHDVIIAEGALAESFIDDDSRGMFHNAHEYRTLYADAPAALARYCAPRLDEGYEVEAIRQRLALRAGLESRDEAARAGNLLGFVDRVTPRVIEGWAQNADHPEAPVCLDVYAGGRLIGQVLANRYREDLERAGIGGGCHSFLFTPPAGIAFAPDRVEVCRSLDGALLAYGASRLTRVA
jgi:Hint domain/Domain of unknown function (DUF4214)